MYFWMYPEWYPTTPLRGTAADPAVRARPDRRRTVDQRLLHEVARALLDDPAVSDGCIDLHVQNGIAILDGDIGSQQARRAAVAAAASIIGIRDVCDALLVTGASRQK
ncbi:BON domain-containing protein [Actinoplanes sp. NPDC048967]|uniref:BON domain-containing protein n=1 Tax=Actinoplanes sp. NPDC048967 TaxID=3155269 RepID=UPI0033CEF6C5